jgi:hypothetical protein
MDEHSGWQRSPGRRLRSATVVLLLILGAASATLANAAVYVNRHLMDSGGYVSRVAPLPQEPAVASVVADRTAAGLVGVAEVTDRLTQALPEVGPLLGPPLEKSIELYVRDLSYDVITSEGFSEIWTAVNLGAHRGIVGLLGQGDAGPLGAEEGRVVLELAPLREEVNRRLQASGIEAFRLDGSAGTGEVVLLESDGLRGAQSAFALVERLRWLLPLVALTSFAGAVWLSRDRRQAVYRVGVAIVALTLLFAAGLRLTRQLAVGAIADEGAQEAALVVWRTFLDPLWAQTTVLGLLGALVALGAAVLGFSAWARSSRRRALALASRTRNAGAESHAPSSLVARLSPRKRAIQGWLVVLALGLLVLWPQPTVGVLAFVAGALLLLVLAAELLAGSPVSDMEDAAVAAVGISPLGPAVVDAGVGAVRAPSEPASAPSLVETSGFVGAPADDEPGCGVAGIG